MFSQSPRILLIGHYGGHNTGDDAMLMGLLDCIQTIWLKPDVHISSKSEDLPSAVKGKGYAFKQSQLTCRPWVFKEFDIVILGGGTHHMDDYKGLRSFRHALYLFRYTFWFALARLCGCRVLALGIGVGPLRPGFSRVATCLGLCCCHSITVRDKASFETLPGPWLQKKTSVAFDLAGFLSIPKGHQERKSILGICPVFTSGNHTSSASRNHNFWMRMGQEVKKQIHINPDLTVRIFVFRGGEREDDNEISWFLYHACGGDDSCQVELVPYSSDPQETWRKVAESAWFIAARYHSLLFSSLAGCKTIPVVYQEKVESLADQLGVPDYLRLRLAKEDVVSDIPKVLSALLTDQRTVSQNEPFEKICRDVSVNAEILCAAGRGRG